MAAMTPGNPATGRTRDGFAPSFAQDRPCWDRKHRAPAGTGKLPWDESSRSVRLSVCGGE